MPQLTPTASAGKPLVDDTARRVAAELRGAGYSLVRGLLSSDEVAAIRELCDRHFAEADEAEMPASQFVATPELAGIPFRDEVVGLLRHLYGGPYATYPNFTVREDVYVDWHVDTAFTGAHRQHVWDPDFFHVQCAIYLQDNNPASGGGLDVRPHSHMPLAPSLDGRHPIDRLARQVIGPRLRRGVRLESRAGDLVLWHARTEHRSTDARARSSRRKYGIFFSTGRDEPLAINKYLCHLVDQRVQRVNGRLRQFPRYAEIADLRYPESFPRELVERLDLLGLRIATF
jgi:hypothetical protein